MPSAEPSENVDSLGEGPSTGPGANEFCYVCGNAPTWRFKLKVDDEGVREVKACGKCSKSDMRFKRVTATDAKKDYLLGDKDVAHLDFINKRNPRSRKSPLKLYRLREVTQIHEA